MGGSFTPGGYARCPEPSEYRTPNTSDPESECETRVTWVGGIEIHDCWCDGYVTVWTRNPRTCEFQATRVDFLPEKERIHGGPCGPFAV